jgi:UDP-MurNAc hydroxylase
MTDSALVIEGGGVTILNANDAKLMGPPLKHLLKQHPSIDFVLRSHSSANPRLCFELIDNPGMLTDDLEGYIRDFVDFSKAVNAEYAIPFASNQCYLHPQTFKYNKYSCTPEMVKTYAGRKNIEHPEIVIMVSGDSWSTETGFDIKGQTWFSERERHLKEYLETVDAKLKETALKESRTPMNLDHMERYFKPLLKAVPWPLRRVFKDKPFLYRLRSGDKQELLYILDIYKKTVTEAVPEDVDRILRQIIADAAVIRQCVAKKIFSHLGISKRVIYRTISEDRWLFEVLFTIFTAYENNIFPLTNILTLRFIRCWFNRRHEILLYMQIVLRKIRGKSITYSDLLTVRS